jgi:hypothetical protein
VTALSRIQAVRLADVAAALEANATALVPEGPTTDADAEQLAGALNAPPSSNAEGAQHVTSRDEALAIATQLALPRRRRELALFVVDELVSNALRTVGRVGLTIALTPTAIDITVTDDVGSLDLSAVRRRLAEALRAGGDPTPAPASAGLGLYLVFRRAAWLRLAVAPGRFTVAEARIELAPRRRPFAALLLQEL